MGGYKIWKVCLVVCVNHCMTRPPNISKEGGLGIMVPLGLCVSLRMAGEGVGVGMLLTKLPC